MRNLGFDPHRDKLVNKEILPEFGQRISSPGIAVTHFAIGFAHSLSKLQFKYAKLADLKLQ